MENRAVVESVVALFPGARMTPFALPFCEVGEVLHSFRRFLFKKAAHDHAFGGMKHCVSTGLPDHGDPFWFR
jgi:hypothetical protein